MSDPPTPDPFAGLFWLTSRQAQLYVCSKSLKAWYVWRRRHGIVTRNNGTVNKADLERELKRRKPRRVMAKASLDNLKRRAEPAA